MAPVLATLADLKLYLGIPSSDTAQDPFLTLLLTSVEAQLLAECGRTRNPFTPAQIDRVESCKGTGTSNIWLDYPIDTISAIDWNSPNGLESLDPDDNTQVVWIEGSRIISLRDGSIWGDKDQIGTAVVTYTTLQDLPGNAKLAVIHASVILYRKRGSEEAKTEKVGAYTRELLPAMKGDPIWEAVVSTHRTGVLR